MLFVLVKHIFFRIRRRFVATNLAKYFYFRCFRWFVNINLANLLRLAKCYLYVTSFCKHFKHCGTIYTVFFKKGSKILQNLRHSETGKISGIDLWLHTTIYICLNLQKYMYFCLIYIYIYIYIYIVILINISIYLCVCVCVCVCLCDF